LTPLQAASRAMVSGVKEHASELSPYFRDPATARRSGAAARRSNSGSDDAADEPLKPGRTDPEEAETADLIDRLEMRHGDVLSHEAAHLGAAGAYAKGGASYTFQIGPDGKAYAIGGEVKVDMSPIPGNPSATIAKMIAIRSAALAPSDPSPEDLAVASRASQIEALARADLAQTLAAISTPGLPAAAERYMQSRSSTGAFLGALA
jgi:hypothetical protein